MPASTSTTVIPMTTSSATDTGPVTVFVTSTSTISASRTVITSSATAGAVSSPSQTATTSGLHGSAKTAVAVAVPIGVVAIIAVLAAFFIMRHRRNKAAKEARRAEVEDYGFNPNSGGESGTGGAGIGGAGMAAGAGVGAGVGAGTGAAALGAAAASRRPEMSQTYANDDSADGYRGWGSTQNRPMDGHAYTNRQSMFPGGSPNGQMGYGTGMGLGAVAGGALASRNDMDEKQAAMADDDHSSKYSGEHSAEHKATTYPNRQSFVEGDDYYDQQHASYELPPIIRENTARRSVSESTTPTRQSLEFANGIHAAF